MSTDRHEENERTPHPTMTRAQERLSTLARVIETVTGSIDLDEVMTRIVSTALGEFGADRAWLLRPVTPKAETGEIVAIATAPGWDLAFPHGSDVLLTSSRRLILRALETRWPVVAEAESAEADSAVEEKLAVRSQIIQVLAPGGDEKWALGMHQCSRRRTWTAEEVELFAEIGRYATIALTNATTHRRAMAESARMGAILDQIPEDEAIHGPDGALEQLNVAAQRDRGIVLGPEAGEQAEARARFEAVLDSAPIGIAVVSPDELRFELVNAVFAEYALRLERISGDSKLIGLRASEVIPGLERTLREVAESRRTSVDEALEVNHDGRRWYVKQIVAPVIGRLSGEVQSLTVVVQDVTQQVNASAEIEALAKLMEERSARLDSIIGSMTDALWVYDATGRVIDLNPATLAMFGLGSRAEAVAGGDLEGFNLRSADGAPIDPDQLPHLRALRGEVVPDFVAVARPHLSQRDLDLSIAAAPIRSGGGIAGAVLVIRDITALQELDRKKDEFLSVASHELRTPLTTIKGYTQLLVHGEHLDVEERAGFLRAVLAEVDRMMGLISELLDVSRIETNRLQINPQPVIWTEFIHEQAANFRVQNPDRALRVRIDGEQSLVLADPDRMRQVIDNLLSNAIKYSAEGTTIDISITTENGKLVTSIADHGIGIPEDELAHLFERFHRARNVSSRYYGGLGLGLYIVKAIIEAHNGKIAVASEEGSGAEFTIELPLIRES